MKEWNWKERIVAMLMVRDELYKADKDELWEYYFPEVAADISDISAIQKKLGVSFSDDYINFLLCADGWKCFSQDVNLFGTKDYETEMFAYAQMLLKVEFEYNKELYEIRDFLLPVAVSKTDQDLFVMVLKEGEDYGRIIWLAGGEIDRFDSFSDFFEAMIEYNRDDLEELSGEHKTIEFKVNDVVFDTVDSVVEMVYDTRSGYLSGVVVSSNASKTHQSTKRWNSTKRWYEEESCGPCSLSIEDLDTLSEIADSIKDKEWLCIHDDSDDSEETPYKDENIKQAVLKRLYNAGADLADFVAERLKEGGFDDITDSEGWTNLFEFTHRLNDTYNIDIPFLLMKDLSNVDSRFLIKEPDIVTVPEGNGKSWAYRPPEKYFITLCK